MATITIYIDTQTMTEAELLSDKSESIQEDNDNDQ